MTISLRTRVFTNPCLCDPYLSNKSHLNMAPAPMEHRDYQEELQGRQDVMRNIGIHMTLQSHLSLCSVGHIRRFLGVVINCSCCQTHQQRRPTTLSQMMYYPRTHRTVAHACQCSCRLDARMCVRAFQARIRRALLRWARQVTGATAGGAGATV